MRAVTALLTLSGVISFAAASPQSGSPAVCITGPLSGSLPAGLDVINCSAGQECTTVDATVLETALGPIFSELPVSAGGPPLDIGVSILSILFRCSV